jgi:RNA polymerase sigma factor (sigma-70 family)
VPPSALAAREPVADLLARAADGEQDAWNALVERYQNLLWSVARSYRLDGADAADVVQTTWLRLVENLTRIKEPDRLAGWLATTVRRECLRTLRRRGREVPAGDDGPAFDVPDDADPLDAALLTDERDAQLWTCFGHLSGRCQQLLRVLMASPAPSYAEVSAALDMPVGSIGPTRGRCLERLRALAESRGISLAGLETVPEQGGPR